MSGNRPGPRWASATAIGAALALVAGLVTGLVFVSASPGPAPASSAGKPIAVRPVQGRRLRIQPMRPYYQPRTAWPAAETATASITAALHIARGGPRP